MRSGAAQCRSNAPKIAPVRLSHGEQPSSYPHPIPTLGGRRLRIPLPYHIYVLPTYPMHRRARGKVGGDEVGWWACGWPVEGPLRAALGALNAARVGRGPPGKKCVLRDGILCVASMGGSGEGCHDDSSTLLYMCVCLDGSVVFPFFWYNPPYVKGNFRAPCGLSLWLVV